MMPQTSEDLTYLAALKQFNGNVSAYTAWRETLLSTHSPVKALEAAADPLHWRVPQCSGDLIYFAALKQFGGNVPAYEAWRDTFMATHSVDRAEAAAGRVILYQSPEYAGPKTYWDALEQEGVYIGREEREERTKREWHYWSYR